MAEAGCDSLSFASRWRGWKDHSQTGFLTDWSPRQFQADSVKIQLSHPRDKCRGTEKGSWLRGVVKIFIEAIPADNHHCNPTKPLICGQSMSVSGVKSSPFPRLSSNPNSATSEKEPSGLLAHSLVVNLFIAYQITMPGSFCSKDSMDWHVCCAWCKVGAQCTGRDSAAFCLLLGSFCLELLWILCTPRVRACTWWNPAYCIMTRKGTAWWRTQEPQARISAGQLWLLSSLREIGLQALYHWGVSDGKL